MDSDPNIQDLISTVHDENHEIERLLGRLDELVIRNQTNNFGLEAIGKLISFCVGHIANENKVMKLTEYGRYLEHAADHTKIFSLLTKAVSECGSYSESQWALFIKSLREIYYNHIAHYDDPLSDYLHRSIGKTVVSNLNSPKTVNERLLEISEQHQELERLLGMLDEVFIRDNPTKVRLPILGLLVEYVSRHIQLEEDTMRIAKYKNPESHFDDHGRILNIISRSIENCEMFGQVEWSEISKELRSVYLEHREKFDNLLFETLTHI